MEKAFHTFLRNADKPFDYTVSQAMWHSTRAVMEQIGGTARLGYTQSDEASIIINNALTLDTQPWFDNNIQKMVSVASSIFAGHFGFNYPKWVDGNPPAFDARVFTLPDLNEVVNYLVWRQQDATRNSIRMYASTMFSHKELHGVNNTQAQEMMFQKAKFNWNDAITWTKRGTVVTRSKIDLDIPVFTADRGYIEKLYLPEPIPE